MKSLDIRQTVTLHIVGIVPRVDYIQSGTVTKTNYKDSVTVSVEGEEDIRCCVGSGMVGFPWKIQNSTRSANIRWGS